MATIYSASGTELTVSDEQAAQLLASGYGYSEGPPEDTRMRHALVFRQAEEPPTDVNEGSYWIVTESEVTIESVSPYTLGMSDLPAEVVITGTGFTELMSFIFNTFPTWPPESGVSLNYDLDVSVESGTQAVVTVSADNEIGTYHLHVVQGESPTALATLEDALTIALGGEITATDPDPIVYDEEAESAEPFDITITGEGYTGLDIDDGYAFTIQTGQGSLRATNIVVVNDTTITATLGPHAGMNFVVPAGDYNIRLLDVDGKLLVFVSSAFSLGGA